MSDFWSDPVNFDDDVVIDSYVFGETMGIEWYPPEMCAEG